MESPPRMAARLEWRGGSLQQAVRVVSGGAEGVGRPKPFEARRSQVGSRCWTWSARIWVDNAGVWFGSDQSVSMLQFFSLKRIKCTVFLCYGNYC